MGKNFQTLSKKHILPVAILVAMAFTYAGVDLPFFEVIAHTDFLINFFINLAIAYVIFRWVYFLHFKKEKKLWVAIALSLGAYYIWELLWSLIYEYDKVELTELYSISLPFVTLLIILVNVLYYVVRSKQKVVVKSFDDSDIVWIDSTKGRIKLKITDFKYAELTPNNVQIIAINETFNSFYSLKQFQSLFSEPKLLFRLNKNYLSSEAGIESYTTLNDGRLKIMLFGGAECVVSKNKAASFKKWLGDFQH